jgi:hypothetical protein
MKIRLAAALVSLVTIASVGTLNMAGAATGPSTPVDCVAAGNCAPLPAEEPKPVVTGTPIETTESAGVTENEPYKGAIAEYDAKHSVAPRATAPAPTSKTAPKATVVEQTTVSSSCG